MKYLCAVFLVVIVSTQAGYGASPIKNLGNGCEAIAGVMPQQCLIEETFSLTSRARDTAYSPFCLRLPVLWANNGYEFGVNEGTDISGKLVAGPYSGAELQFHNFNRRPTTVCVTAYLDNRNNFVSTTMEISIRAIARKRSQ
jgi:hypothetical protein